MERGGGLDQRHVHTPHNSWIEILSGLLGMILPMLLEKTSGRNMGLSHFSKWPPWKSNLYNFSSYN